MESTDPTEPEQRRFEDERRLEDLAAEDGAARRRHLTSEGTPTPATLAQSQRWATELAAEIAALPELETAAWQPRMTSTGGRARLHFWIVPSSRRRQHVLAPRR